MQCSDLVIFLAQYEEDLENDLIKFLSVKFLNTFVGMINKIDTMILL